jgi:AcrR family transcriptional regulator
MARLKRALAQPPRERILQAARELFHREGIHGVSVDARAADKSRA